jgi:hypothetical protein
MIGRKKLREIRAELEAALSGPGGLLEGSSAEGTGKSNEVVESLRRFLATKPQENGGESRAPAEGAQTPTS